MDGLAYLLSIVAVVVVLEWAMRNDKKELRGKTSGLLAMIERNQST